MKKIKPRTVRDMAHRRGLSIHKAMWGGWYVTLNGNIDSPTPVLYATHDWKKARAFVKKQPIIVKRAEIVDG
jgi:hypothetical protein